jgi:hypothetical protein
MAMAAYFLLFFTWVEYKGRSARKITALKHTISNARVIVMAKGLRIDLNKKPRQPKADGAFLKNYY